MNLNLNDDALQALVSKAIVDTLTPEMRENLITSAVKDTLQKVESSGGYNSDRRSPLQRAFDSACRAEAERFAREQLENDPVFQEQLQGLFKDAAAKLFAAENRESLVSAMADTIRIALTKDRY